jgi:hypothetical protein
MKAERRIGMNLKAELFIFAQGAGTAGAASYSKRLRYSDRNRVNNMAISSKHAIPIEKQENPFIFYWKNMLIPVD